MSMTKVFIIKKCEDCPSYTATSSCALTQTKNNDEIPDACPLPNGNPEDDFSCYLCRMNHISQEGIKIILQKHLAALNNEYKEERWSQYLQSIYDEIFGE